MYRTNPRRHITDNYRNLVRLYARLRHREVETFPDGREILYQPIALVRAWAVFAEYFRENEPKR